MSHGGAVPAAARTTLVVDSIGYLVPRGRFAGVVHSVFAGAVNFAYAGGLVTLLTHEAGAGPTTMVLDGASTADLRTCFARGAPIRCRARTLVAPGTVVVLDGAQTWRPATQRERLPRRQIDAHLALAAERLAQQRPTRPSIVGGRAAPLIAALSQASRTLDREHALRLGVDLIGWGEGLTPACDDFLVGFLAGLDTFAVDPERRQFCSDLGQAIAEHAERTTDLAAHLLRLSAMGHFGEVLLRLRDALLCEPSESRVELALERAFAVGATSGADTVSGLVCALQAWLSVAIDAPPA